LDSIQRDRIKKLTNLPYLYSKFLEIQMKRVTGIGGIFFTAKDPKALCSWYKQYLGIDVQDWGGTAFTWSDADGNPTKGTTVWSVGADDGKLFAPSTSAFMINYRVEDLESLLQVLRDEGCNVLDKSDYSEYGKFGWVIDPEGNKVELWQPPSGQ
jgi:predicted enzyme related to lactoylglutathione lyase